MLIDCRLKIEYKDLKSKVYKDRWITMDSVMSQYNDIEVLKQLGCEIEHVLYIVSLEKKNKKHEESELNPREIDVLKSRRFTQKEFEEAQQKGTWYNISFYKTTYTLDAKRGKIYIMGTEINI